MTGYVLKVPRSISVFLIKILNKKIDIFYLHIYLGRADQLADLDLGGALEMMVITFA